MGLDFNVIAPLSCVAVRMGLDFNVIAPLSCVAASPLSLESVS